MKGMESILVVDLSAKHAAMADWSEQIAEIDGASAFSAIVLMQDERGSNGFSRRIMVVKPNNPEIVLSEETGIILEQLSTCRMGWTL